MSAKPNKWSSVKVMCKSKEEFYAVLTKMEEMGYESDDPLHNVWDDEDLKQGCLIARESGKLNWGWSDDWFNWQYEAEMSVEEFLGRKAKSFTGVCFED